MAHRRMGKRVAAAASDDGARPRTATGTMGRRAFLAGVSGLVVSGCVSTPEPAAPKRVEAAPKPETKEPARKKTASNKKPAARKTSSKKATSKKTASKKAGKKKTSKA